MMLTSHKSIVDGHPERDCEQGDYQNGEKIHVVPFVFRPKRAKPGQFVVSSQKLQNPNLTSRFGARILLFIV
jgi:hypothetical protein